MESSHFELIEKFLLNQLDSNEKMKFIKILNEDLDFKKEYEIQRLEHEAMELLIETEITQEINSYRTTRETESQLFPKKLKSEHIYDLMKLGKYLSIAASITGLIIISIYLLNKNNSQVERYFVTTANDSIQGISSNSSDTFIIKDSINEKNLFDESINKSILPDINIVKVNTQKINHYAVLAKNFYTITKSIINRLKSIESSNEDESKMGAALNSFETKNFKKCIDQLSQIKNKNESHILFLIGHSYYNLGNYKEAVLNFKSIVNDTLLPMNEEAKWYLLLCYANLQPEYKSEFEILINELCSDQENQFYEKAVQFKDASPLNRVELKNKLE